MFQIKLDRRTTVYSPGDQIEVSIIWHDELPGQSIVVSLCWGTMGKGTASTGVALLERLSMPSPNGQQTVRFTLPRGPLSCNGKLLSIQWFAKAERSAPQSKVEESFVLSRESGPIQLGSLPVCEDKLSFAPKIQ
jgi:hypothetical protein